MAAILYAIRVLGAARGQRGGGGGISYLKQLNSKWLPYRRTVPLFYRNNFKLTSRRIKGEGGVVIYTNHFSFAVVFTSSAIDSSSRGLRLVI